MRDTSNFVKEYDEFHIRDRLYIYWDITTRCNYKCDYCYARNKYLKTNEWNREVSFNQQILVVNALKFSQYPIYLGFHGGEPTLHNHFFELCDLCLEKCLTHELSQLYIVTNGSTDVFGEIKKRYCGNPKIRFLFSFHPTQSKNPQTFLDNLKTLVNSNFKTKANILLPIDPQYWELCKDMYLECSKLTKTHPHFIYDCVDKDEILRDYSEDFYQYFNFLKESKCYYIFEEPDGTRHRISDYELFRNGLNSFTGWNCWNNNYEILYNGILKKICTGEGVDLTKNPLYFKNLTIKPMTCTFKYCNSDGVLKCYKEIT